MSHAKLSTFTRTSQIDLPSLVSLVGDAWAADYQDRSIMRFDEAYLRWLLPDGRFVGVLAQDASGRYLGCEVALDRVVELPREGGGTRLVPVSYVTLLTVHPDARGQGLAQRILARLTEEAIHLRDSEFLLSVFDENAAGRPTVEKHLGAGGAGEWKMLTSASLQVWAASPDLRVVHLYEPLQGAAKAALLPGIRRMLEFRGGGVRARAHAGALDFAAGPAAPRGRGSYALRMLEDRSHRAQYRESSHPCAGQAHWVRAPGAGAVAIDYHRSALMRTGLPDGKLAQIQSVGEGTHRDQVAALRAFNASCFEQGMFCTFLVNTQGLPAATLLRAGFLPADRRVRVALRGPRARIEALEAAGGIKKHLSVDVL